LKQVGGAALVALLVIDAGYEFSKVGRRLGDLEFVSESFAGDPAPGNRFRNGPLARLPLPVPADFLQGMDVQRRDFEKGRTSVSSYLAGEMKAGGWWYYYLYGLGVKVPLRFLALIVGGLGLGVVRLVKPGVRREVLVLYLPAVAILTLVSSQTGFNHHVRYALPAVGFLIVGAGWFGATLARRSRWGAVLVLGLCLWGVGSHLRYYPHSLSYFNEVAGGPGNGHAHLIDSNIDWGQDLTLLKDWEDKHPEARPMRYALFTYLPTEQWGLSGGPAMYTTRLPGETRDGPPSPGWYAVSVTVLRGRPTGHGRLPNAARRVFLSTPPMDRVGYSILIYHLPDPAPAER
jgi:hypothetical protein